MKPIDSSELRSGKSAPIDVHSKERKAGRDERAIHESAALSRLARSGIVAFFVYGVGIALTYGSQLVIARIVGVDIYGVYAYVFAWVGVLAYISALGFDVALLRFVPTYEVQRSWALLQGVIQYAQSRAAAIGVMMGLLGAPIVFNWSATPDVRNAFLVGFVLVPIMALVRIRCSILRAFGGVTSALVPDRIVRDGLLIVIVSLAAWARPLWTMDGPFVMSATVVSSIAGLGATFFALRRRRPVSLIDVSPKYDVSAWRRAVIPLVLAGATEALMNRTGTILLGWMDATKDAGIYSLAFNISLVVSVPRIAVNTLFAPAISALHAQNDKAMMQILVTKAASWTLFSGFCIALVLFVAAEPLLTWFGPGYEIGVPVLRILLVSQVIAAGAGSQFYLMTMTGHEDSAAAMLMLIGAANGVVSALLIGPFGMMGAGVATGATLVIWNGAMAFFIWRRLKLLPGVIASLRVQPAADQEHD